MIDMILFYCCLIQAMCKLQNKDRLFCLHSCFCRF